jgi:hypothetical protein
MFSLHSDGYARMLATSAECLSAGVIRPVRPAAGIARGGLAVWIEIDTIKRERYLEH